MKFWITYIYRWLFNRSVWVPVHMAGSRIRFGAVKRKTDQIHTHVDGWTEKQAQAYCDELNSPINR